MIKEFSLSPENNTSFEHRKINEMQIEFMKKYVKKGTLLDIGQQSPFTNKEKY